MGTYKSPYEVLGLSPGASKQEVCVCVCVWLFMQFAVAISLSRSDKIVQ